MDNKSSGQALRRVVISAGGTGGHIFPGLALVQALQSVGVEVFWVGCDRQLDKRLVAPHLPLHPLPMQAWRGRGLLGRFRTLLSLLRSCWQSWRYLRRFSPDAVVTFGGYVTVPLGLVASFMRIPLVIHEQNCVAGSANRLLASRASVTMTAFPDALPGSRVCGNPLRPGFDAMTERAAARESDGVFRVLVMGGSLGAAPINDAVVDMVLAWEGGESEIEVRHQTGESDYKRVQAAYGDAPVAVMPFIHDMLDALQWADLVIARSGALTVSEIAAVGVASILIPYPKAIDDHQCVNAMVLGDAGAAMVIRENTLSGNRLTAIVNTLVSDPGRCQAMATAAASTYQPDAVGSLMRVCAEVSHREIPFEASKASPLPEGEL